MVMTAFERLFYTDKELEAIEAGAAAYDRQCEEELAIKDTPPAYDIIAETYRAIEEDNFDTIQFLQRDIALMVKLREAFPDDPTIPQYARFFIDFERYEIERIRKEIEYVRETAKEFKRLRG
jgi:hypothetical protein